MFTPKRNSTLNAPNSARVTRSQSLKTNNEFFSPSLNASGLGMTSSGRISLTMSSIYNDINLESYKSSLPIRINELIFNLKSHDSSQLIATILQNGHVCLVSDRKLYIWKLKKSIKNIQCNELVLPYSRSLIKQNCVSVECHNNKDYVGLCVTVEGSIRYWPSIFNEYLCVDAKFDLQSNDEVASLMYISESFYIVITSNGNLYTISIENVDGKITPITKQIDTSSGLFSSVGRRMTSLIFGGSSVGLNGSKNFKSAVRYKNSSEIYILVDKNLQKWKINNDNTISMISQLNVEKLFYEEYIEQYPDSLRAGVIFQDCSITKNSIYILAFVNDEIPKLVIGEIDNYNQTANSKLKSFQILNYRLSQLDLTNQYRFHALDNQHAFYVYNSNSIVSFTGPTLEMTEESKFNTLGDRIIASNFFDGNLLFFSLNHGILKTKDNSLRLSIEEESFRADANQSMDASYTANANLMRGVNTSTNYNDLSNVSMQSMDDISFNFKMNNRPSLDFTFSNMASADQFNLTRLKEAFQCYLKKEERESQELIDEVLRSNMLEKKIDLVCVELSEKLIDDMPAHDPRWAELNTKTKSLNTNLIISNQLKGKMRLHEYFITFLKKFQIWDNLTVVTYNGREIETKLAIQEHGEKLQLALTIREQLYPKNPEFINLAIEFTTKNREEQNAKLIYPHDLFYRRVSKIDDIFNALYLIENDVIKNNSNEQAINYLIDTTSFYNKMLKVTQTYRQEKQKLYEINLPSNDYLVECLRWTFLPINELTNTTPSILNICIKQHKLCSEYGLSNCNTIENKSVILQSLCELDSLIFDEYEIRLNSLKFVSNENETEYYNIKLSYDSLKTKLIDVFIKYKQMDNAMKLAEQIGRASCRERV